jgi:hypothetical protein
MKKKIEDFLNVICVISNPCNYKKRIQLAKIFIEHMNNTKYVKLYIVECIYPKLGQTKYQLTQSENPHHLQLTAETILWTKENMINLGVQKLLPSDYKAFAFIDADLHFNNHLWAKETLCKLLKYDILQVFQTGYNLNKNNNIDIQSKMLYSYCYLWKQNNINLTHVKHQLKHPGWGWAMTRKAYEKMDGLFDLAILGGGDTILAKSLTVKNYMYTTQPYSKCSIGFIKNLYDYQQKCLGLSFSYVSGSVYHYYHGSFTNRKYIDRWNIIIYYKYNPNTFISRNTCGMYQATDFFPSGMRDEIIKYFKERNEDD